MVCATGFLKSVKICVGAPLRVRKLSGCEKVNFFGKLQCKILGVQLGNAYGDERDKSQLDSM